jgi:hypothetical protein
MLVSRDTKHALHALRTYLGAVAHAAYVIFGPECIQAQSSEGRSWARCILTCTHHPFFT